jgi:flagellar basal-body rod protein FlgB
MIQPTLFDRARLEGLKKALVVYSQRHRVVSENVANVETAGYRAREYKFEELLRTSAGPGRLAGTRTDQHHLPVGRREAALTDGQVAEQESDVDNGVNNVDVDREMAELATTDLSYRLATRVLSMKYRILREAVSGQVR